MSPVLYQANSPIPVPAQSMVAVVVTVAPTVISAPIGDGGALVPLHTLSATGQHVIATATAASIQADNPVYAFPGNFNFAPAQISGGGAGGDCNVTVTDRGSIVCGADAAVSGGGGCIAIGYHAQAASANNNDYTSDDSNANSSSVAYGTLANAGVFSVAIGCLSKTANTGVAIGNGAKSSALYGVAIGNGSSAGNSAMAAGVTSKASGYLSTGAGASCNASGGSSAAFGDHALSKSSKSSAFGSESQSTGIRSLALGASSSATAEYSAALGSESIGGGYASTAIGAKCTNKTAGTTAVLAGFVGPTAENGYTQTHYQMHFFILDGKPHIGFAQYDTGDTSSSTPTLTDSYAVDLSPLAHVEWQPTAL